jgi:tetratricopeptide (TPR) repeat protein
MQPLCENGPVMLQRAPARAVPRWRTWLPAAVLGAAGWCGVCQAQAQVQAQAQPAPPGAAESNSRMDALLFYQLLIGEMQLQQGQPGAAYSLFLDAARRRGDEQLFRRAVDIALQGRAGDEALAAARSWRATLPASTEALRTQLQILSAMNRVADAAEPLTQLLALTPEAQRGGLIASLPRFFGRNADRRAVATMFERVLQPYLVPGPLRAVARSTVGSAWLAAGDRTQALALARRAAQDDPDSPAPALLALELAAREPEAETLVRGYLQRPDAGAGVHLAYARLLWEGGRAGPAVDQLGQATRLYPDFAPAFLMLGALELELKHLEAAETALLRYVELLRRAAAAPAAAAGSRPAAPAAPADTGGASSAPASASTAADDDDEAEDPALAGAQQAWLMLARVAEQRGNFSASEAYLARVNDPERLLEVQTRRATLAARQGQVAQAREMLRQVPERGPGDARAKVVAEAQVLRDVKRWQEAYEVLDAGARRWPEDGDLLYEQSMVAEKLDRLDDMERLLRRVITLKPDSQHAYNALGYSLADRGQRLQEARELIRKALELAPGDPFITDSMGWVEFRLGNHAEALRLLREAYAARPDTEIAAHLGEVLWVTGQREEAVRIWREGRKRDATNDVLRETLARLKPPL